MNDHTTQRPHLTNLAEFEAPDPYKDGLEKLRREQTTPESRFAEEYREAQIAEFAAEQANAPRPARRPRLTTLAEFEPPDPYRLALDKMRSNR